MIVVIVNQLQFIYIYSEIIIYVDDDDGYPWEFIIYGIIAVILAIGCIMSCISYLHSNCCRFQCLCIHITDSAQSLVWFLFAVRTCDLITDINVAFIITWRYFNENDNGSVMFVLMCASIVFVLVPYFTNIFVTLRIRVLLSSNKRASKWFRSFGGIFSLLVIFSGDAFHVCKFISSNCLGLNFLDSGLIKKDLQKIEKYKIISITVLEVN